MNLITPAVLAVAVLTFAALPAPAQDAPPSLVDAEQAFAQGRPDDALKKIDAYVAANPNDARGYFLRAALHDEAGRRERALPDYDKAIALDPKLVRAYDRRGTARFMLGQIDAALADWDKQIELRPDASPHHWQRGIALYYAGRFEDGARQFEVHKTVNPNDVENAAWHFLCVARWKGVDAARAGLIPIEGDGRVPMMTVHKLFAGKATPDDVFAEAKKGDPAPAQLTKHTFYAHLYVALYYEALGKPKEARHHIDEAVKANLPHDYMYNVAVVHQKALMAAEGKKK